ncbi:hypothetical protein [Variovorax sp. 278MFTsu5.1]|uniref:hypothetical protein n=1 Tax=Variovorax sp. 278MFTsu5.1 TaxID=3158366 RepID=UPI003AAC129C
MAVKIDGNGPITGSTSVWSTGDFKWRQAQAADAGWIAATGGTIGNSGSGATNRANADTLALFTLWWTDYTDAQLPIQTVTGSASTRGASAAADWAAGKRLTVFDVRGRFIRAPGTINGLTFVNGNGYATSTQVHQHKMPIGFDGGPMGYLWADGSGSPVFGSTVETGAWRATFAPSSFGSASVRVAYTAGTFENTSGESAGPSIVMLPCYKL